MESASQLERIIVVPWNGYVNRLQAWASTSILADRLGVPLQVAWEAESVAPAQARDLFADSLVEKSFIPPREVAEVLGRPHQHMPRYLTVNPDQGFVFLAGHDRGEQHFMAQLEEVVQTTPGSFTLVIVAGGKFHLPGESDFSSQRRRFYSGIDWHPDIDSRLHSNGLADHRYLGLHIRQTDRSRDAPTPRTIEKALMRLLNRSGVTNLFIAADTDSARAEWIGRVSHPGFRPLASDAESFDRTNRQSGQDAIVDWLLLGRAEAIVYSAASSFGQEAAVMNAYPEWSQAVTAPRGLRTLRDIKQLVDSALGRVKAHKR